MKDLYERLNERRPIVADGAMGTMLYSLGVPKGHCYDELNLSNPEIVIQIHRAYAQAGAEIIETNTFGANRFILEKYYDLGKKTFDINYFGAKIARDSCPDCFIAGAVGPLTRPLELAERLSSSEMEEIFASQINALLEGGVDLIILETFADLAEATIAFKTAKRYSDKPVVISFSFTKDGLTVLGLDPGSIAKSLIEAGAKIIGVNCSTGPQGVFNIIKKMAAMNPEFLVAMPNAGQVNFQQGRFFYPDNPEYFAYYAKRFAQNGVSIIGGCCGTTPEHIKEMALCLKGITVKHIPASVKVKEEKRKTEEPRVFSTALSSKAEKKFLTIIEMETPKGTNLDKELLTAQKFLTFGVDAVSISDSPMGRVKMNPLPLAYRIKKEVGLDVILHITCRDRNILGLQADLLAAYALGIENILALTGDPPSAGDYPFAVAVYEVTATGLIEIAQKMNQGLDGLNNPLSSPTGFWIGAACNGTPPDMERELNRIKSKLKAGARFLITQPVFDLKRFEEFLSQIKPFNVPIFAGLLPLSSVQQAEYLKNEVPGITIPKELINRLKRADNEMREGITIAQELRQEMKNLVNGICLMTPSVNYEKVLEVLI